MESRAKQENESKKQQMVWICVCLQANHNLESSTSSSRERPVAVGESQWSQNELFDPTQGLVKGEPGVGETKANLPTQTHIKPVGCLPICLHAAPLTMQYSIS